MRRRAPALTGRRCQQGLLAASRSRRPDLQCRRQHTAEAVERKGPSPKKVPPSPPTAPGVPGGCPAQQCSASGRRSTKVARRCVGSNRGGQRGRVTLPAQAFPASRMGAQKEAERTGMDGALRRAPRGLALRAGCRDDACPRDRLARLQPEADSLTGHRYLGHCTLEQTPLIRGTFLAGLISRFPRTGKERAEWHGPRTRTWTGPWLGQVPLPSREKPGRPNPLGTGASGSVRGAPAVEPRVAMRRREACKAAARTRSAA